MILTTNKQLPCCVKCFVLNLTGAFNPSRAPGPAFLQWPKSRSRGCERWGRHPCLPEPSYRSHLSNTSTSKRATRANAFAPSQHRSSPPVTLSTQTYQKTPESYASERPDREHARKNILKTSNLTVWPEPETAKFPVFAKFSAIPCNYLKKCYA